VPLLTAQVPLDQPFGHTSLAQLLTQTDGTVAPLTGRMDIGFTEALVAEQPLFLQTVQLELRHIPGCRALTELAQHLGIAVLPPRQQIQGGSANGHGGLQLAALEDGKTPVQPSIPAFSSTGVLLVPAFGSNSLRMARS